MAGHDVCASQGDIQFGIPHTALDLDRGRCHDKRIECQRLNREGRSSRSCSPPLRTAGSAVRNQVPVPWRTCGPRGTASNLKTPPGPRDSGPVTLNHDTGVLDFYPAAALHNTTLYDRRRLRSASHRECSVRAARPPRGGTRISPRPAQLQRPQSARSDCMGSIEEALRDGR